MSLKDEINKLISIKKAEIENEKIRILTDAENLSKRVSEIMPLLQELTESARVGRISLRNPPYEKSFFRRNTLRY